MTDTANPPCEQDLETNDVFAVAELIADCVAALDERPPTDPAERIERWQAVNGALEALKVVVGQMAAEAADAMQQLGRARLATPRGPVHLAPGYGKEEADGDGILNALAVDGALLASGEVVRVVPLDVLRDVIPAVSPGQTSSKWKKSGLRHHGLLVDHYVKAEPAPLVVRVGEPFQR